MSDYIPSEIQIKIFCQLPVKSILRFRSVSKEWKSLIDSSEFNSDYIVHQTQPKRLFLRLYRGRVDDDLEKGEYCMIVDDDDDDDDDSFPRHKISLRYPQSVKLIRKINKCLEFVGSSYGLVCFTGVYLGEDDCFDRYVIWNPSIRKSVTIDVPYNLCMDEYGYKFLFVGFGVCPKSLDPKIVRMIMGDVPNDYYNNNKHGVRRYVAELVAYEPDSKQVKKLGFNVGCYSITSYIESLLLLDQSDTL